MLHALPYCPLTQLVANSGARKGKSSRYWEREKAPGRVSQED